MLSVLIPVKDEQDNLYALYHRLIEALEPLPGSFEVVVVDDGSRDQSPRILSAIATADERIKVVRLRRNYGQTAALQAAIDHSCGDVLVTMDGDLQNDPRDIPVLLAQLDDGYDAVLGQRVDRKDGFWLRKVPSWLAHRRLRP